MTRCGRSAAAARPAIIRYAGRHLGFLAVLLIAGVAFGVAYRYLFDPLDEQTVPYYIRSCIHAMGLTFAGWSVHLTFAAVPRSRLGGVLRRLPLSAEFIIKALTMTVALTIVAVGLQFVLYPPPWSRHWLADELPRIVVIGLSVSLFVGAIFEFRRMIGGRVLGSFLLGTYHRPRREERIVMFLDIAESTALAERLGEVRVHDLITRFFSDIDQPIADQDGEVHAYVGDEVIVTWPLSENPERNARPLRCLFAVEERMMELAPSYAQEFGVVPRFRAGIHAGPVVVSECGVAKRQIAYFGDTMNVAARLCEHSKVAGETLVASADLLRSAAVPQGLSLGRHASLMLRGRRTAVEAHAVRRDEPARVDRR
ncbi:MAG TPA: adenylate/guanylate cyclase domain-containing protein [Stellaceae bacterium]|nr:adenylate/guanylate cyclase domain-containing protein [Stellaceae bacterium]